jgi:hypothetical protein
MLLSDLNMLIDANPQNVFVQRVLDCGIRQCSESEQRIFYYLCHHYVSWGDKEMAFQHLADFISDLEDEQKFFRFFQAEKLNFQKMGLVRFGGEQLLEDSHFKGIQERLDEMGMRKGFNIILYGSPGTGKTETTLQLARKTGRDA